MLTRAAEVVGARDPTVASRLAELAAELVIEPCPHEPQVRVLGRVEVVEAGATRPVRGRSAQLLGLLALQGRCTTESAAAHLWPDVPPDRGRERLRTVLARTRRDVGPVVARDDDAVCIPPGIRVDAWEFERLATRALDRPRGRHGTSARAALALHDGRAAPDLEGHEWAMGAIHRLRDLALALHDCLADEAEDEDDTVEAIHQLQAALVLEPTRDHRAMRAARLLAATGHEGQARDLLDRTAEQMLRAGLEPSAALSQLAGYLGRRAGTPRGGPRP